MNHDKPIGTEDDDDEFPALLNEDEIDTLADFMEDMLQCLITEVTDALRPSDT